MRQYRGLTKEGKWVYGFHYALQNKHYIIPPEIDIGWSDTDFVKTFIEVIPETVGQDTGLKDKNGTEIYEGDILQWDKYCSLGSNPMCPFVVQVKNLIGGEACMPYAEKSHIAWEIIGNIHQNPKLMEQE